MVEHQDLDAVDAVDAALGAYIGFHRLFGQQEVWASTLSLPNNALANGIIVEHRSLCQWRRAIASAAHSGSLPHLWRQVQVWPPQGLHSRCACARVALF